MRLGTVREIKCHEYRVGLTPSCVKAYCDNGHEVFVEKGAGENAGFPDADYAAAGAQMVDTARAVFDAAQMIVKVKEPLPAEYDLFHEGQILYTYLHLAPAPDLTQAMLAKKVKGVAYETIELADRTLPCLKPMSEIAGRLAPQEGAKYLEKPFGGRGVLLGGVPGVARGNVVIIGAGVVGTNACKIAMGLGAQVTVLDISPARLEYLDDIFGSRISTLYSTPANIEAVLPDADLVIGAVLIPGATAPKLIRRRHLKLMQKGAVIVDVAVDQGGCIETTRPTTHDDPVFIEEGVVHYCVANMPGAVSRTSTQALTSTTLRYGLMIANQGLEKACAACAPLARGVNVYGGKVTYEGVAESLGLEYTPLTSLIG